MNSPQQTENNMSYDVNDPPVIREPAPSRADYPPVTPGYSKATLRAWRSKYPPHIGEKQMRRAAAKAARAAI